LWSLFVALAEGQPPAPEALDALRTAEADGLASGRLVASSGGYAWTWTADPGLERPLRQIVHAAVDLLTTGPLDRLKTCPGCGYAFVDETKNGSRRWCAMEDCGTDEKMRRFVARRAERRSSRVTTPGQP
jgi:predicted RNA-binding Zn ribbon-like protein